MLRHSGAVALLAAMGLLLVLSMRHESPTTDEPVHLTRGLAYFWGPDASLSYAHPPLGNAYAALPVALTAKPVDLGKLRGFGKGNVELVSKGLLAPNYEVHRRWLFVSRAAVAVLTLASGLYLYAWCVALWGVPTGLWALFFFSLHPTLIAHGRLNTTDMAVTAFMFVSLAELVLFLTGRSRLHGFACALFMGLSLACKYTGLTLVPITCVLVASCGLLCRGRYASMTRVRAGLAALGFLCALGVTSLGVLGTAYRFERTGLTVQALRKLPEPENHATRRYAGRLLETELGLGRLWPNVRIPVPHTYLVGLASIRAHDRQGHATMFLGQTLTHGHPGYFPLLLAIKTPALLLCALAVGAWLVLRRRAWPSLPAAALSLYSLGLLLLAMRASINIGVRHVLPVMPALCVLGGRALARVTDGRLRSRGAKVVLGGLAASHALGLAWAFPDYLSDFNALVGGRAGGERISIVGEEWGQDTERLGRLLRSRGVRSVYFQADNFTGALELKRMGVTAHHLRCRQSPPAGAWAAVMARSMARARTKCLGWTSGRRPSFEVPGHVFVFAPTERPHVAVQ